MRSKARNGSSNSTRKGPELPSNLLNELGEGKFGQDEWKASHNFRQRGRSRKELRKIERKAKKRPITSSSSSHRPSKKPKRLEPLLEKPPKAHPEPSFLNAGAGSASKDDEDYEYYARKLGVKNKETSMNDDLDTLFDLLDGSEALSGEDMEDASSDDVPVSNTHGSDQLTLSEDNPSAMSYANSAEASEALDVDRVEDDDFAMAKSSGTKANVASMAELPWEDDSLSESDLLNESESELESGVESADGNQTAAETMAKLIALKKAKNHSESGSEPHEDSETEDSGDSDSQTDVRSVKYIPPSRRDVDDSLRLKRQINGALNRLAEANIGTVARELVALFGSNSRAVVTEALTDILLSGVSQKSTLQESYLAVRAGVVAALYKGVGIEFAASFLQDLITQIDQEEDEQRLRNLVLLTIELYALHVVSARLMYDLIHKFLDSLSTEAEKSTDMILAIIRNGGGQLRGDDPGALRETILDLQSRMNGKTVSSRTRFLIESVVTLKNNRQKPVSATLMAVRARIRKLLAGNPEPIQVSLQDIRDVDTKGKWWLVGSAWRGKSERSTAVAQMKASEDNDSDAENITDLGELARQQRLNTDIRRAIFSALMGADDFLDACQRIDKLGYSAKQEREVPHVLLHCLAAEEVYNPYYALIAVRQCTKHQMRRALMFALWDFLNELEEKSLQQTRKVMHYARFYAALVGQGALTLDLLKTADLLGASGELKTFVEVFLVFLYKYLGKQAEKGRGRGIDGEQVRDARELTALIAKTKDKGVLRGIELFYPVVVRSQALDERSRPRVLWAAELASAVIDQVAR